MRILQLTPGTGSFLCGSCLRDNALATGLRALGHDVVIAPLYLPFVLEEPDAPGAGPPGESNAAVRMGGINVYLQQKLPWLATLPRFVQNVFDSPRLLRWASSRASMTDASALGEMTLSMLRGEHGRQAAELEKLVDWMTGIETPDVVLLSNAMLLGLARRIGAKLDRPVLCTLQGEAPFLDALPPSHRDTCWQTLRERSSDAAGFLAVSRYTADLMADRMGIAAERMHVVPNGIDLADYGEALEPVGTPPTIGFLARMCRDKGVDTLVDAYLALRARGSVPGVRLRIGGVRLREDEALLRELERRVADAGASDDVEFRANLTRPEKLELLRSLSVLSVPARYGESFGLYLIEAMACGVPVVQPAVAAFPEIIDATGGGVVYDAEGDGALVDALEAMLLDESGRATLGRKGREAVFATFGADRMASDVARVCREVTQVPGRTEYTGDAESRSPASR